MSFAKKIGKHLNSKYGQKPFDSAKKSTIDAIKTASKRAIEKTAEATGDLTGNIIADKTTSVLKKSSTQLLSQNNEANDASEIPKERYISPDKKLLMN